MSKVVSYGTIKIVLKILDLNHFRKVKRFWVVGLLVVLSLAVIGGSTYLHRYDLFKSLKQAKADCQGGGQNLLPGQIGVDLCLNSGLLSIYAGDGLKDYDICSSVDILNSNQILMVDDQGSYQPVTCNSAENSIALSPLSVSSVRQNTTADIYDIIFEDLRGYSSSDYTLSATISDFSDGQKSIILGSNPDGETNDLDLDAPVGDDSNKLFALLDPSSASLDFLISAGDKTQEASKFQKGAKTSVVDSATPITLLSTTTPALPGRIAMEGVRLKIRVPALVKSGNYSGVITQTIV